MKEDERTKTVDPVEEGDPADKGHIDGAKEQEESVQEGTEDAQGTTAEGPKEPSEPSASEESPTPELGSKEKGPSPAMKFAAVAVGLLVIIGAVAAVLVLSLGDEVDEEDGGDNGGPGPLATFDIETFGFEGNTFHFSINVTGNVAQPNVTWRFGDGHSAFGQEVERIYGSSGNFTLNVTVVVDGRTIYKEVMIEVRPIFIPDGLLPRGAPPDWTVRFSGVPSLSGITILGMTEAVDQLERINITLQGVPRSFVGLRFLDLLDLASVRSDAEGVQVVGATTFSGVVQQLIVEERTGGNASYVVFAEGGEWLDGTDLDTPLMFLGSEPDLGDIVKDVEGIVTEPFRIVFTGIGLEKEGSLNFDDMLNVTPYRNFTVFNGMETNTWIGFPLWDVMGSLGVRRNATDVEVGSSDGYSVLFDIDDIYDNPESDMPIFLAFGMNDEPLLRQNGPYRLLAPDSDYTEDDGHNWYSQSWVKQVKRIDVGASDTFAPPLPWGAPASGTLNISWSGGGRTYTTLELSMMWDMLHEMDAILVKSSGTRVNGTYVGIDVFDLVEMSGCPLVPGELRFIAGDGYGYSADAMELTLREKEEMNGTMVALTENGQWYNASKGPLRVVSSALSSKGWVSNLTRIEVKDWTMDLDGEDLTMTDVLGMTSITVPVESKGVVSNYTGVDLVELGIGRGIGALEVFGYDFSDGLVNATGYSQIIDLVQFACSPAGERPLFAYIMGGERIPLDNKGPLRIIVPGQSSKYWVGSVKAIRSVPLVLVLRSGSTYSNMTLGMLDGLGFVVTNGNASALNETGAASDITFTGVALLDLLEHAFGSSIEGNLSFVLADGTVVGMNYTELSGVNRTAIIAWDLGGEELSLWNGLFALVLSDTKPGDPDDWTHDMWRYSVVSVEVSP